MNIYSEKPLRSSALSHNHYAGLEKPQPFFVKSGLILRTAGAFIMEMEYANDSHHSSIREAEELNISTLILPYQLLAAYATQLTARRATTQILKIPQKMN